MQEHCIPGSDPDPAPDPDPDPDAAPDPEPDEGMAVVVAAAAALNLPFVILTFPFLTEMSKVNTPESPSSFMFF